MSESYDGKNIDDFEFCPKCGRKLIKTPYIESYDLKSGNPIIWTRVFCPKNTFFNTHFDKHFDAENEYKYSELMRKYIYGSRCE